MLSQLSNLSNLKSEVNFDYVTIRSDKIKFFTTEIDCLDFSQIDQKLVGTCMWSKEKVQYASSLYKKWLVLQKAYPNVSIAPNELIDEYWHMHILDTKKYMTDCMTVFGYYLHHYPYFGLNGDEHDLEEGFTITKELFKKHFNLELIGDANPCSSTSCR